ELAPASLLTVAVGAGCLLLGSERLRLFFAISVAYVVLLFGVEVWAGMRREVAAVGAPRSTSTVGTLGGVALRLLRARASWVALTVVGSALVGVLAALSVIAVRTGQESAGATRLSQFAFSVTGSLTLSIGVLGVGAAVLLLFLAHQSERQQALNDVRVFTSIGFSAAAQTTIARRQSLFIALASCAVGLAAIGAVSKTFSGDLYVWLAGAAALALVISVRLLSDSRPPR
ncbi:MAG: hypothetical protein LBC29_00580, partial [Propionibacteriaceae bacterium]|nr:hypothetical protein [Propionibacteriaceae bacterium]